MAIEKSIDQMQIARSATSRANGQAAGQMRLGACREGGNFFVPDMDPFDLALPAERIRQTVQAVADNAIDPLDACCGQSFRELISDGCHDFAPSSAADATAPMWAATTRSA